ncbi:TlpA family protein disulfide reductase [Tenacibaculum sp. 190524A02b]|uniref:TlpA family protein disulfide reductase n=1 Tax=Tenacibaculum vairaonense TaxID=3137860 RepID=UPI0031FA7534
MKKVLIILITIFFTSCTVFQPKSFTKESLEEKLVTINRDSINLNELLKTNKNKQTFIQVYASYCPYSQDSFKDVEKLQEKNNDIDYVFLSVDHSYHDWKRGLENLKNLKGQHYYIPQKGKGAIAKFIKLKTIPRFLLINTNQEIVVFKSAKVADIEAKLIK